jgi:hypothetical protein
MLLKSNAFKIPHLSLEPFSIYPINRTRKTKVKRRGKRGYDASLSYTKTPKTNNRDDREPARVLYM